MKVDLSEFQLKTAWISSMNPVLPEYFFSVVWFEYRMPFSWTYKNMQRNSHNFSWKTNPKFLMINFFLNSEFFSLILIIIYYPAIFFSFLGSFISFWNEFIRTRLMKVKNLNGILWDFFEEYFSNEWNR